MYSKIKIILCVLVFAVVCMSNAGESSVSSTSSTRLCFLSDLNGSYGSIPLPSSVHSGMAQLQKLNCGLVIGAGDLVAGQDPSLSESQLRSMWDEFKRTVLTPLDLAGVPILSALGNHEVV